MRQKLQELFDRLQAQTFGDGNPVPAILAFDYQNAGILKQFAGFVPIWGVKQSGAGGCKPLNDLARQHAIDSVTDLVLYDLPPSLGMFAEAVTAAKGTQRLYTVFQGSKDRQHVLPSRDMFKTVYGAVKQQADRPAAPQTFLAALSRRSGLSPVLIDFMLEVFVELGLIHRTERGYIPAAHSGKKELSGSKLYQQRQYGIEVEETLLASSTQQLHQWLIDQLQATKPLLEDIV